MKKIIILSFIVSVVLSCNTNSVNTKNAMLPILGKHSELTISGRDTIIYHRIPDFSLRNQYNESFGSCNLKNKVYLTEFFFTSCPSVCPKVAVQMKRIHQVYKDESRFALLSITLDPKRDTPQKLFNYAEKRDLNHSNWFFLNGAATSVYDLAQEGFYIAAYEDTDRLNDNIMHDGVLVLTDGNGHIRGMYDGKDESAVEKIKQDVDFLLADHYTSIHM